MSDDETLWLIVGSIFVIVIAILIVRIPIIIAKRRGISGSDLGIISLLSWLGLLLGITWIVALVFSMLWQPKSAAIGTGKMPLAGEGQLSSVEALEKLGNLKDKGIITEDEFNREKAKLLNSL